VGVSWASAGVKAQRSAQTRWDRIFVWIVWLTGRA
jgi:hypothetical protein